VAALDLAFEHSKHVGVGTQPCGFHSPDNVFQVFFINAATGKIMAKSAQTQNGEWADLEYTQPILACTDEAVEFLRLRYYTGNNVWVMWKNPTEEGESGLVRHRLAVLNFHQKLSEYLVSGSIELRQDNPVAQFTLTLENPNQHVSGEHDTLLVPGASITFKFRAGNSAPYPMGRFFVDRNKMSATDAIATLEGRNTTGKLLKDQRFDDERIFPKKRLHETFQAVLENAGILDFWVGETTFDVGMEFPPDMAIYEGLVELLKTVRNWVIKEELTGTIGIGRKDDLRFTQPGTYSFEREKDVFSRAVARDDEHAYSRVCVHNDDFSIKVYRDVDFRFAMARKKTLYVPIAQNTTLQDATEYTEELSGRLSQIGIIETFTGPWRPHLQPGDAARILGPGGVRLLGTITTVIHKFGKTAPGFITEFVVDSGGQIGKAQISEYIMKIAGRIASTSKVKRLY